MKHDCGILFVHGIGEQPRADTLLQSADPLIRWLDRWLTRKGNGDRTTGRLLVERARVSEEEDSQAPAHAVLSVTVHGAHSHLDQTQRWLLAEGRWAQEVRPPTFGRLAGWMLTTGAWIVLSHALRSAQSQRDSKWRAVKVGQALFIAVITIPLLQVVIALMAVLAVLPIPRLRALLSDALLRASGVLGDSYVLLESAVQREAIVDATWRSLDWLAEQCDVVAVIAHSQGAAIAHRALRRRDRQNVKLFVTYGSGLAKLEELDVMSRSHHDILTIAKYGAPLTALALLVALRIWFVYDDPWAERALMLCIVPVMMLGASAFVALKNPNEWKEHLSNLSLRRLRPNLDWLDLYATADPVSNGPLPREIADAEGVESSPVVNRRSLFWDHTSYWQNDAEFIPAVLARIDRHFKTGLQLEADPRLHAAAREHGRRVSWLSAGRWACLASIAGLLFALGQNQLVEFGRMIGRALSEPPLALAGSFLAGLGETALGLWAWVRGLHVTSPEVTTHAYAALGAIGIAGAVAIWNRFFIAVWSAWERSHVGELFKPHPKYFPIRAGLQLLVLFVGLAPMLVSIASWTWPTIVGSSITELAIYRGLGKATVIYGWILCGLMLGVVVVEFSKGSRDKWGMLGAFGFVTAWLVFLTPMLQAKATSIWPGLTDNAIPLVGFGVIAWFLHGHINNVAQGFRRRWAVLSAAPFLALGLLLALVWERRMKPASGDGTWSYWLFMIPATYVIAQLVTAGVLWLVRRRAKRREPAPEETEKV